MTGLRYRKFFAESQTLSALSFCRAVAECRNTSLPGISYLCSSHAASRCAWQYISEPVDRHRVANLFRNPKGAFERPATAIKCFFMDAMVFTMPDFFGPQQDLGGHAVRKFILDAALTLRQRLSFEVIFGGNGRSML